MSHIIGIMGPKGSGKNTVAKIVKKINPKDFDNIHILSFADILKDVVSTMFSLDRDMLEGITEQARKQREQPIESLKSIFGFAPSGRDLLLIIGTKIMRNHLSKNIWSQLLMNKIRELDKNGHNLYLITDCRFLNEIKAIEEYGSHRLWMVIREHQEYFHDAYIFNTTKNPIIKLFKWLKIKNIHPTERDWIRYYTNLSVIHNNGTLTQLKTNIKEIL